MYRFVFTFLLHTTGNFAAEILPFPISPSEPKGLSYISRVLSRAADDQVPQEQPEKPAQIVSYVRKILETSAVPVYFDNSSVKSAIHQSVQKLLLRSETQAANLSDILYIYNRLELWEESDLPYIIYKYFKDRSYSPLLVRFFSKASPEMQKRFATRVRTKGRYEFVETALLYQAGLLRDDELIHLFRRLLDDAYFTEVMAVSLDDIYEHDGWDLARLKSDLFNDLHRRLRLKDPGVVAVYHELRRNPATNHRTTSDRRVNANQRFLQALWTGNPSGRCEFRLVNIETYP